MDDIDYENLSNIELAKKIEEGDIAERFERSSDWLLVREACQRAKKNAQEAILRTPPTDVATIVQLQMVGKIFGDFIPSLVTVTKNMGKLAHEEKKLRGIMGLFK